jgi:hypothetical protein
MCSREMLHKIYVLDLIHFWLSGVLVNLSNLKLHVAKRDNAL